LSQFQQVGRAVRGRGAALFQRQKERSEKLGGMRVWELQCNLRRLQCNLKRLHGGGAGMAHRRLGQIDMSTGEVLEDGFVAWVAPKRKNGFGTRWVAMSQDAAMTLAQSDLGTDDFRVLMSLLSRLDFENLLVLNQAEVGRELKMQRQNVQRSVKRLIGMGVLLEGPRIGVSRSYRLNPQFGWKGSARNHVIALDQERKRRMAAAGISGVIARGTKEAEASLERDPNTLDMFEDLPR